MANYKRKRYSVRANPKTSGFSLSCYRVVNLAYKKPRLVSSGISKFEAEDLARKLNEKKPA